MLVSCGPTAHWRPTSTSSAFPDRTVRAPAAPLQPVFDGHRRGAPQPPGVSNCVERDDVVLVHDHQEAFGLTVLGALGPDMPPVLHTLHWDLRKHPELYGNVRGDGSAPGQRSLVRAADHCTGRVAGDQRRPCASGHATGRAGRPATRPPPKAGHLVVLGRITRVQGQDVAARIAHRPWAHLSCWPDRSGLATTPARPGLGRPTTPTPTSVTGGNRCNRSSTVAGCSGSAPSSARSGTPWWPRRATLFPIDWEEPGGTAVTESLALARRSSGSGRGCLPELVESGRTGVLVSLVMRMRSPQLSPRPPPSIPRSVDGKPPAASLPPGWPRSTCASTVGSLTRTAAWRRYGRSSTSDMVS